MEHVNNNPNLKQQILDLINEKNNVSFVELENIPGFKGDYVWDTHLNIILWQGISLEGIKCLQDLLIENKIDLADAGILTYIVDGKVLNVPLAKKCTRKYNKTHWFPVMFNTVNRGN